MQEQPVSGIPRRVSQVIHYIQQLILDGTLQPGDRLPTERDLARQLQMCRGSARAGVGYLAVLGIVRVRHGVGTFLSDGKPGEKSPYGEVLGSLRHFNRAQCNEARSVVIGMAAVLAAQRRNEFHVRDLADELTEIFASITSQENFLEHEVRFQRLIAESSRNPVLVAVIDLIHAVETSSPSDALSTWQQRLAVANGHREIYKAIRTGCPSDAVRWAESLLVDNCASF